MFKFFIQETFGVLFNFVSNLLWSLLFMAQCLKLKPHQEKLHFVQNKVNRFVLDLPSRAHSGFVRI